MSGARESLAGQPPGVRHYSFLCLAAAGLLFVVLLLTLPLWAAPFGLVPVVIGLIGVTRRWRIVPLALLVAVTGLIAFATQLSEEAGWRPASFSPATELLLSAAVLTYIAAHYRLQGLTHLLFPRDPRQTPVGRAGGIRPEGRRPSALPLQRSPGLASSDELVQLLLAVPVCLLLALLAYRTLVASGPMPDLFGPDWRTLPEGPGESALATVQLVAEALWRGRFLLWTLGAGSLVVSGVLSYLAWQRRTRAEAMLFLQDVVWADTRGEERRIDAWLVGARRRRRRKESS